MTYNWWNQPRNVSIIVDNPSWILPFAESLVDKISQRGDVAKLCHSHDEILEGGIAFYLGCVKITPQSILKKNHCNLVVHESNLPEGKGFAPLTWQILEGKNEIIVSLIEAAQEVDAGNIILQKSLYFEGHELCHELRAAQGEITIDLCLEFLSNDKPDKGRPQHGKSSYYPRRYPKDSELDINKTITEQFNLLRVVDNERYPAFFNIHGETFIITIRKKQREDSDK